MEKSIETIWKEGFLKNDTLVIPKLNNLYNRKSQDIIAKLLRMLKINLIAIVIGSVLVLTASFFMGVPIMGIGMFLVLNTLVFINYRQSKTMIKPDVNENSYSYLYKFNNWLEQQVSFSTKVYRYAYPLLFLSVFLGFWFKEEKGSTLGKLLIQKILNSFPETALAFGVPIWLLLGVSIFILATGVFGAKLYRFDLKLGGYERIFKKINTLLMEMEELRK